MRKITTSSLILIFLICSGILYSQEKPPDAKDLFEMSLSELMNVQVTLGTLTPTKFSDLPVSYTRITADEIAVTPARNLLDLLEVYVPGAVYVNHWMGPRIGLHGVLGDQNTSYLLLINGVEANTQNKRGVLFEIYNRDLNSIKYIDVVRGPASVTYGSGAIGGIINITTIDAGDENELTAGVEYNPYYRYQTVYSRYNGSYDDLKLSLYGSISNSAGEENPDFYYIGWTPGYGYGFLSDSWGYDTINASPPNFYEDFADIPQVRLQMDLQYKKDWRLWAHYSSTSFTAQQQTSFSLEGPAHPGYNNRLFIGALEHAFSKENYNIQSRLGFESQSHKENMLVGGRNFPFDDIHQLRDWYSENTLFARSVFTMQPSSNFNFAAGAEFDYFYLGADWGEDKDHFLYRFPRPVNLAVYDTNTSFYDWFNNKMTVTNFDDRIDATNYSLFAEGTIDFTPNYSLLLSGRYDKNTYSDGAFSPRIAFTANLFDGHIIKGIWQKSIRLPAFQELFTAYESSQYSSEPEVKSGIDLLYNTMLFNDLIFELSGYYNIIDQIAWDGSQDRADIIGTLELAGFDVELHYKEHPFDLNLNYAFVEQLEWNFAIPFSAYLSNIGPDSIDVPLGGGYGENRINNLPKHALKFYAHYHFYENFLFHVNGRLQWDYQQDVMLESFKTVHDNYSTAEMRNEMTEIYNELLDYGYTKPSFTLNASVRYRLPFTFGSLDISVFAMNLISVNHIRYVIQYWGEGNQRQYPRQVGFIEEPLTVGIGMRFNFLNL